MPRSKITVCKRGHLYTPENTVIQKGGKSCKTCKNANAKIRYNANAELRSKILADNAAYRKRRIMLCFEGEEMELKPILEEA